MWSSRKRRTGASRSRRSIPCRCSRSSSAKISRPSPRRSTASSHASSSASLPASSAARKYNPSFLVFDSAAGVTLPREVDYLPSSGCLGGEAESVANPGPCFRAAVLARLFLYHSLVSVLDCGEGRTGRAASRFMGSLAAASETPGIEARPTEEERLCSALTRASVGTWHWDLEAGTLAAAGSALALLSVQTDAPITYRRFLASIHSAVRASVARAVRNALWGDGERDSEYRCAGSLRFVCVRGGVLRDADGRLSRLEGVAF